jgi:hypothetical protein
MDDYKNVLDKYVPGRPLLKWDTLKKIPAGVKRLHDWYMRASSIGIDTINVSIPPVVFVSGRQTAVITFRGHVVDDEPLETRCTARNGVCIVSVTHTNTCMCYF